MSDTKTSKTTVSSLGKPLDPTTDPQELTGELDELRGITDTKAEAPLKMQNIGESLGDEEDTFATVDPDSQVVSQKIQAQQDNKESWDDESDPASQFTNTSNDTLHRAAPPHVVGEQSVSGDMPDPESDDDMLVNSYQVGLRLDEDIDDPQPLNMAADVAAAERLRREKGT